MTDGATGPGARWDMGGQRIARGASAGHMAPYDPAKGAHAQFRGLMPKIIQKWVFFI
jgi:hypothetical protein